MSLQSTQQAVGLAGQIIGVSGRFARIPLAVPAEFSIALIHGESDSVIPVQQAKAGFQSPTDAGAAVTLDVVPELGHTIDRRAADLVLKRL